MGRCNQIWRQVSQQARQFADTQVEVGAAWLARWTTAVDNYSGLSRQVSANGQLLAAVQLDVAAARAFGRVVLLAEATTLGPTGA